MGDLKKKSLAIAKLYFHTKQKPLFSVKTKNFTISQKKTSIYKQNKKLYFQSRQKSLLSIKTKPNNIKTISNKTKEKSQK